MTCVHPASFIIAAVVPTLFVTFAVIDIMIPTAATAGTEQNNIGKWDYLDEFNQTGVFIRHKRGMRNIVAIEKEKKSY